MDEKIMKIIADLDGTVGVYIEDFTGTKGFTHQEGLVFPSASIIKIPILVTLFLRNFAGEFSLDQKINITEDDLVGGAGVLQYLENRQYTIRDLATLMIIQSDNTATNLLIDFLGVDEINQTIKNLGLHDTYLSGKLMVIPHPYPRVSSTTPQDMAYLLRLLGEGKIHSWLLCHRVLEIMKKQMLNDMIPKYISLGSMEATVGKPNPLAIAHKTGAISGVVHDVGIVYHPGRDFIFVGMCKDLANEKQGIEAIAKIAKIAYDEMNIS